MKRSSIAALVLIFGTALATTAFAQGRHDEKPHGSTKPSAESTEGKSQPMAGGRHDERPHGTRKAVDKKAGLKKADTEKASDSGQGAK
jgi:hypothetical protein